MIVTLVILGIWAAMAHSITSQTISTLSLIGNQYGGIGNWDPDTNTATGNFKVLITGIEN